MTRKSRIHYPGGYYHVMLLGNGGEDIYFSEADRSRFYLLLQEGVERYRHRIHVFCLMTNHLHLIIQVGETPLSRIMQNVSFRYTRYLNTRKNKNGHVFQGRYKALLIDGDSYLVELVRYIHCNPLRAGLVCDPGGYQWSSHHAYLGKSYIPWLSTNVVLGQFSKEVSVARKMYRDFVLEGAQELHRHEFHAGTYEGRILGDENFSEQALALADEKVMKKYSLEQLINAVCLTYAIEPLVLAEPGKKTTKRFGKGARSLSCAGGSTSLVDGLGEFGAS